MIPRVLALVVAVAGAAIVTVVPTPADALTSGWSMPFKVSGSTRHAWFPDVAADDNGNVHIVWAAEYPEDPRLAIDALWYSHSTGQTFSDPRDIAVVYVGDALRNALAVDSGRRLHLIYKGFGTLQTPNSFDPPRSLGPEDLWYTATDSSNGDSVQRWMRARQITRGTLGYYADLAIDSHGVLHAIWTEADGLGWGLYYARSTDGGMTWSARTPLDDRDQVWWYRTHLIVDEQDALHVVWEVTDDDHLGRTRAAFYARSVDGGRTWTSLQMGGEVPRKNAENDAAGPQQPAIAVDGNHQVLFVYRELETDRIMYRVAQDGTRWSAPQTIPGIRQGVYRPYDIYDAVTDAAGSVHFVMVGYPVGSDVLSLMHVEWDGRAWRAPQVIAAGPPFPEYPKIAISNGNRLHVVWFNGDRITVDRLAVGIWYSTTTTSAPRVISNAAAVPLPDAGRASTTTTPSPERLTVARSVQSAASAAANQTALANPPTSSATPSSVPILAAMAAVGIFVSGVVLVQLLRSREV